MTKAALIRAIEDCGVYCKVRINTNVGPQWRNGEVTGMRVDQDYRYNARTNTGGRRLIGYFSELSAQYDK